MAWTPPAGKGAVVYPGRAPARSQVFADSTSSKGVEKNPPLVADDFHQHPFAAAPVELAVKNLFPGPEIEPAPGYGHH